MKSIIEPVFTRKNHRHWKCAQVVLLSLSSTAILASSYYPPNQPPERQNQPAQLLTEQEILQIETKLLGAEHAADHAQARIAQAPKSSLHSFMADRLERMKSYLNELAGDRKSIPVSLQSLLDELIGPAQALAGTPDQVGQWTAPAALPVIGVSAVLLPTGKVLFWNYDPFVRPVSSGLAYLWNPADGTGRRIDPPFNIFCAAQILLADGRVLVVGGNLSYEDQANPNSTGLDIIYTFNPFNETWIRQPDMRDGRWYPTATLLPDGRAVITSGLNAEGFSNPDVEVFTPSPDLNGVGTVALVGNRDIPGRYPHQFVLPNGRMLMAGPATVDSAILNPADWSWQDIPNLLVDRDRATGVLLPGNPNGSTKVMLIGGRTLTDVHASTEIFDAANPAAPWQFAAPLPQPRNNSNTVILPDGKLLAIGGNQTVKGYLEPLLEPEIYDPAANTWNAMAPQAERRAYHATALLLPDGRVLSAGDDGLPDGSRRGGTTDTLEIFSPPYLFSAGQPAVRPVISTAPATVNWGQSFSIGTANTNIAKAVLIAPGATTHANDMHQRYVSLVMATTAGGLTATAPPNANVAPPGYYMLFLVNTQGVPSVAKWVRIGVSAGNGLSFSAANYTVTEGTATATITVTRSGSTAGTASVNYTTANGSALAGSDYTATAGTLSFAAGQTSKTFAVPITNDTAAEVNETVNLTLSSPAGASLGANPTAVLTINDNDAGPSQLKFSIAKYNVTEGAPSATISVLRQGNVSGVASVNYATSNGTNVSGNDYTAASGTLNFAANQNSRTFTISIMNDTLAERSELVNLTLSNPLGAVLEAPATATLIIRDNEPSQLQFSATSFSVTEGTPGAVIRVLRLGSVASPASINFTTSNGSATAGADYTATSGTLNFPINLNSLTFSVPILNDIKVEPTETANLALRNPNGALLAAPNTASLRIVSND